MRREPKLMGHTRNVSLLSEMEDVGRSRSTAFNEVVIPRFGFSLAVADGLPGQRNDRCVYFARGEDFSELDADPRFVDLVGTITDGDDHLGQMPSNAEAADLRRKLRQVGADESGLDTTVPRWKFIERTGKVFSPSFTPIGTFVGPSVPSVSRLAGEGGFLRWPSGNRRVIVRDSFGTRSRRLRYLRRFGSAALLLTLVQDFPWLSLGMAQAVIVNDTFTEASDTNLAIHTPDTGDGWTEVENTGTGRSRVFEATDETHPSVDSINSRQIYTAQPDASTAEVDVIAKYISQGATSGSSSGIFARWADTSNSYFIAIKDTSLNPDDFIVKEVADVITDLTSGNNGDGAGTVFKFEVRDATKKLFAGGTERLSTTDNALTAAGNSGIWHGNWRVANGDTRALEVWDDFSVEEISAAVALIERPLIHSFARIRAATY